MRDPDPQMSAPDEDAPSGDMPSGEMAPTWSVPEGRTAAIAAEPSEQWARALVERGAADLEAGRTGAALEAFEEVDERLGGSPATGLRRWLASGLGLRGVALAQDGRPAEAIAALDDLAGRFSGADDDPEVRKQLAGALFNKGMVLIDLGRDDEAIVAFDLAASEFGDDASSDVLSEVATALIGKVGLLVMQGQVDAAAAAVGELDRGIRAGDLAAAMRGELAPALADQAAWLLGTNRDAGRALADRIVRMVCDDPDPAVRQRAAQTLDAQARRLTELGDPGAAAVSFGEIARIFDTDEELVRDVAAALFNRGIALREAGRLPEASMALGLVATRYEGSADSALRHRSIGGLFNKGIVRTGMPGTAAALSTLDEVVTRFGDDEDPQVVDWVRRARETTEAIRREGLHSAGRLLDHPPESAPEPSDVLETGIAGLITQLRRLEAAGELEAALELGVAQHGHFAQHLAPDDISLLELGAVLGWLQLQTGDVNIAEFTLVHVHSVAHEALRVAEAMLAHHHEALGSWYHGLGEDDDAALDCLDVALTLRAERPEDATDYLRTLGLFGGIAERAGRLPQIREQLDAEIDDFGESAAMEFLPYKPRLLTMVAELSIREGRPEAARTAAQHALQHASVQFGDDSPLAVAARALATAELPVSDTGEQIAEAVRTAGANQEFPELDQAYEDAPDAWARLAEVVSQTANSLGVLYSGNTADTAAALEFLTKALRRRAGREEDRYVFLQTLANLAVAFDRAGDKTRPPKMFEEALRLLDEIPEAAGYPGRAELLILVGAFHLEHADAITAEREARTAIEIAEAGLPGDSPIAARAYNLLAGTLAAQHRTAEARVHALHAVAMLERCAPQSEQFGHAQINLAELLIVSGRTAEAVPWLHRGSDLIDRQLLHNLELVPIDERLAMTTDDRRRLDLWLTLARRHASQVPGLARMAFDVLERRKTLGAQLAMAERYSDAMSPELDTKRQELRALRRRAGELLLRPPAEADDELSRVRQEISGLETVLSLGRRFSMLTPDGVERDAPHIQSRNSRWMRPSRNVAAVLGEEQALIEYVRFRETALRETSDPPSPAEESTTPERYLAFVLRADDDAVEVVDLGDADHIDSLVRDYLAAMATDGAFLLAGGTLDPADGRCATAARAVRAAALDPVMGSLAAVRRLVVVPDGPLAAVPLQALNQDAQGFVIDRFEITYQENTHALLDSLPPGPAPNASLVFADPDFDLGAPPGDPPDHPFARLSWTADEGRRVADLLGVSVISGAGAVEATILDSVRPRVLHIATHGWFLPADEIAGERPSWMSEPRLEHLANLTYLTRPGVVLLNVDADSSSLLYGQLLVRCGLITAGFNTAWAGLPLPPEAGDGLITGADVAALDLRGTELVVLSACETGLGQAMDFEGVHGLCRAFRLAGAANMVTALWPVADEGTTEFMGDFYERLAAGGTPARCLHDTQVHLRRTGTHPYLWGGFACQAAARPVDNDSNAGTPANDLHVLPTALTQSATEHFGRGEVEGANRLWAEAAAAGSARAVHNLAVDLQERRLLDEAEDRYRQAAAAGIAESANNLGELLWRSEDLEAAATHLDRALSLGYDPAAATLGHLRRAQGDDRRAEPMLRRGTNVDATAALELAELLNDRGDVAEAMIWWRHAAEDGLVRGAQRFGQVLAQAGDYEQSEIWLRRAVRAGAPDAEELLTAVQRARAQATAKVAEWQVAAKAGDPQAAMEMGLFAVRHGNEDEARRWWRAAAKNGNQDAAVALAQLLESSGESGDAEALVRPLAAQRNADSAYLLGVLMHRRGEDSEAEKWLRQAAEGGQLEATNDLALLLWRSERRPEAQRLLTEAAEAGSDEAARNLAHILTELDRPDEAERWWRMSAEAGNGYAAYGLGLSLFERGEIVEAERWFRRAAVAGEPVGMATLGRLLAGRDDPEAEVWLRRSAAAGMEGDAIVLSQILAARGATEEAERWWRQAATETRNEDGDP
jgi:CHAT domain-containing protein/tetratricopeptide (TPR) repeat protein